MRIQSKTLRNELRCVGGTTQQIQWALIIPNPRNTTHLIVMKRSHGERGHSAGSASLPRVRQIYLRLERPWKPTNRDARSAETLMGYRGDFGPHALLRDTICGLVLETCSRSDFGLYLPNTLMIVLRYSC
jgi:hypothetical protein